MRETFSILVALLLGGSVAAGDSPTLHFSANDVSVNSSLRSITYQNWPTIVTAEGLLCPARAMLIELHSGESATDVHVTSRETALGYIEHLNPYGLTADDSHHDVSFLVSTIVSAVHPVYVEDEISIADQRYVRVLIFPVTVSPDGTVSMHESISLSVAGRAIAPSEALTSDAMPRIETSPSQQDAETSSPSYIIVTTRQLASSLEGLRKYRTETGHTTQIACIEDIVASYSGRDQAEQLRNYLKDFARSGGKYVLLAGDETVLPVRYAYHYTNATDSLIAPENLQLCDLYFADLTGEWNKDNDQTWGERLDDAADLTAELIVGRLPFNRPEDFQTYTANLIQYETSPGNGDPSYLGRAFFYSSDQMRDLDDGQHNRIAEAYPPWMQLDTTSGVEATRGDDPLPSNLSPEQLKPVLQQGFGIVNVIAHGRVDGFVLKSAAYNEWPKTYMLTAPANDGHGSFAEMLPSHKPAFYYSMACDNASYDADQPPFNNPETNLCQNLLSLTDGAVGFVGYTRWGWTGTSYILQRAYFDSLFAHPERSAAEALYAVKPAFYYYRDLNYGLNYFGDPVMKVYTGVPKSLVFASQIVGDNVVVDVASSGQPVGDCEAVIALDGAILAKGLTDAAGSVVLPVVLDSAKFYSLALVKAGYETARTLLLGSIATDVEDDTGELPLTYNLSQNYPNPFNPSTTISFEVQKPTDVSLRIYNMLGQQVTALSQGKASPGRHSVVWDGTDQSGNKVGAGVYLYRLSAGDFTMTKKMVLLP